MRVKIIIATNKEYWMPEDPMYVPLQVGAEGKEQIGYERDDSGDNISKLNPYFCELTGTYWAWKNLEADYIGVAHYRRHYSMHPFKRDISSAVLNYNELEPYLDSVKVFTPTKRNYIIETLSSHYAHTHDPKHLDVTREIISEKYPEYIDSFDQVIERRWGYMFNMMIMKKSIYDKYCEWVFDILFELRERLGEKGMSRFNRRYYGRIAEIIFNVWLSQMIKDGNIKKEEIKEIPIIKIDKTNWFKKINAFLRAKYLHEKYERSY